MIGSLLAMFGGELLARIGWRTDHSLERRRHDRHPPGYHQRVVAGATPSPQIRTAIVVLSFVLAAVTYRLFEIPLKFCLDMRTKMAVWAVPLVAVAAVGVLTHQNDGLPSRRVVSVNPPLDDGEPDGIDDLVENGCGIDPEAASSVAHCLRDSRETPRFALIGDSKAHTLIGGVIRTSRPGGRWLMIGGTNQNGAPVPMIIDHPAYEWNHRNDDIETVVLFGAVRAMYRIASESSFAELSASSNGDLVRQGMATTVDRLVANGKKVVLYVDNPPLTRPENCMKRRTRLPLVEKLLQINVDNCEITRSAFDAQTSDYRTMLDEIASEQVEAVTVFDPNDVYFDKSGVARHVTNGQMMYSFTDHPSDAASDIIGERLNDLLPRL